MLQLLQIRLFSLTNHSLRLFKQLCSHLIKLWKDVSLIFVEPGELNNGRLLISKGDFINEHTSDNIREDYQIVKVLGTGAFGEVKI